MTRHLLLTTAVLAAAALTPAAASASAAATGVGGVPAASQSQMALPDAGDAQLRVPAGKVEHRVTIVAVSGAKAVPSRERQELWLSARRARMVVTNAATGKLRLELVAGPGETRIYDAERRRVTVSRTSSPTPPYASAAFEAALHRAYVQQGMMRVAGERTAGGRRLLLLESVPGAWKSSDPGSRTTALVDALTYEVSEITSALDGGLFRQTATTRLLETLDARRATVAKLAMSTHRGAKLTRKGR